MALISLGPILQAGARAARGSRRPALRSSGAGAVYPLLAGEPAARHQSVLSQALTFTGRILPLASCRWIASTSVKHGRRVSPLPPPSAAAVNSGVTVSAAAFPSLPAATSVPSSRFQSALLPLLPGCLRPAEIPGFWVGKEPQLPGLPGALALKILACFFGRKLGCWCD